MVTDDDIATVITAQLGNQPTFQTILPGDCLFDRGADTPTAYPYGIFSIKSTPPGICFDDIYIQQFQVSISAYVPPNVVTGITNQQVQQFFHSTFGSEAASLALQQIALRNPNERVMHSKPLPVTGTFERSLLAGRDIFICGLNLEIQVQGDRSVS